MGLKLKELQRVVKSVVREEKSVKSLCEEVKRAFGPTILTSHGLERMSRSVNEKLDVLEASDLRIEKIRPSVLIKFANSSSAETRKMVARLLPEHFLKMFLNDRDPSVRATVAKRLPLSLVEEMCKRFPNDDGLYTIKKRKRILESGLPKPKVQDEEFDMYGTESMRDMIGDIDGQELSKVWYDTTARNIIKQYGGNIEGQWEEIAVKRYCDSMKSSGVDVDYEELLDAVYDTLSDRDEEVIEESALRNLADRLRFDDSDVMPIVSESVDAVVELMESSLMGSEYMKKFEEIFSVRHLNSRNPNHAFGMNEGARVVNHPYTATSPSNVVRFVDERAIDSYVKAWNNRERLSGNRTYNLSWTHDAEVVNMVNFHLELK